MERQREVLTSSSDLWFSVGNIALLRLSAQIELLCYKIRFCHGRVKVTPLPFRFRVEDAKLVMLDKVYFGFLHFTRDYESSVVP